MICLLQLHAATVAAKQMHGYKPAKLKLFTIFVKSFN